MGENGKIEINKLSDAEFISFLYSERDRENDLVVYHGWNNWALAGALITIICALYAILKSNSDIISYTDIIFFFSGFLSIVLYIHPFLGIFGRERGIDYTKLKTLKDVAPSCYIIFTLGCSITTIALLSFFNKFIWFGILWASISALYAIALIIIFINRNKLVPSYYKEQIFPSRTWTIIFNTIVAGILGETTVRSFRHVESSFFSPNMEIGICVTAIIVILYLFIKINTGNKTVKEIDIIIDDYLYNGESRENIYFKLLVNRMGKNSLEVCSSEIIKLKEIIDSFAEKEDRIDQINKMLDEGEMSSDAIEHCFEELDGIISYTTSLLNQSKLFSKKINEIKNNSTIVKTEEFKGIVTIYEYAVAKIEHLSEKNIFTFNRIRERISPFYCNKYGGFCTKKDCTHRNEKPRFSLAFLRIKKVGNRKLLK